MRGLYTIGFEMRHMEKMEVYKHFIISQSLDIAGKKEDY